MNKEAYKPVRGEHHNDRMEFEIRSMDGLGRTGTLEVNDKTVRTPALMPVINPHLGVPPLEEAEIVITNAYIIAGSDDYREPAVRDGLHETLGFDGVVVTDSGAYQMSVYGDEEIEMSNREVLEFQRDIGSDVATPLDVPTPPDASREDASKDLETTLERLEEAREFDLNINAPVQGALHTDLRRRSAEEVYPDFDIYPVGGVVPLLQDYRYGDLVDVVVASKKGLGMDAPVHLFGAGHPMVFALAAALGCDLFDSAAYALYARDNRYMTPRGTKRLDSLRELPCSCRVCSNHDADDLRDFDLLAEHNLMVSFAELRRVREAIRDGSLQELVEQRCHAHPSLLNGLHRLGSHMDYVERYDPAVKSTMFYLGNPRRPEVHRHHERLDRVEVGEEAVITTLNRNGDDVLLLKPPFAPFPPELREVYPLNAEVPEEPGVEAVESALEGVLRLVELNPGTEFVLEHPGWRHHLLERLEELGVDVQSVD